MTLEEMGTECGTDKVGHGYLPVYEEAFAPWRQTLYPVLELGVQGGHSMRMWKRWFPLAPIIGVDQRPTGDFNDERTCIIVGDAQDPKVLADVAARGPFAVIVDDCGHFGDQQEASFRALFPKLLSGGVYAVEDLHASYYNEYRPSAMPFLKGLVDDVNQRGGLAGARVGKVAFWPSLCMAWRA